jgi:sigma-B regulation protein RsbU (phosphoserine phosphatase)
MAWFPPRPGRSPESRAQDMAHLHASMMDGVLQTCAKDPEMMAAELETGKFTSTEELEAWLQWMVTSNPEIYGSCIAFPAAWDSSKAQAGYAPYVYRGPNGLQFEQLAKPDYNYFQWAWYREPRDAGMPLWS